MRRERERGRECTVEKANVMKLQMDGCNYARQSCASAKSVLRPLGAGSNADHNIDYYAIIPNPIRMGRSIAGENGLLSMQTAQAEG
jgi:hypothetical protein